MILLVSEMEGLSQSPQAGTNTVIEAQLDKAAADGNSFDQFRHSGSATILRLAILAAVQAIINDRGENIKAVPSQPVEILGISMYRKPVTSWWLRKMNKQLAG